MGNKTVLILEDEEVIRRLLSRVVTKIGCIIQTAGTVHDAIGIVDRTALDLFVTDIKLPDGEGYDVIRRVNERLPGTRTVIVTGLVPSEVNLQEMSLKNIAAVVQKPFTLKEMEARLRIILSSEDGPNEKRMKEGFQ